MVMVRQSRLGQIGVPGRQAAYRRASGYPIIFTRIVGYDYFPGGKHAGGGRAGLPGNLSPGFSATEIF